MSKPSSLRPLAAASGEGSTSFVDLRSIPKKKIATIACSECKTRKTKCSGSSPCDACLKRNTQCHFDEASDQRRRVNVKRKIEGLEEKGELLGRLVAIFRDSENARVSQLLNLIRSDASLDEISMHLDMLQRTEGIEKTPGLVEVSEELHQLEEHHHKASRRTLYDRQSIDIRVFTVPAKPWTTITDDNDFVTHLISLWFTWYQPCFNWVDRDLFIREMQSQDLDSEYCSPFLVNAILADACAYSNFPESYEDPNDRLSCGAHFFKEAKRDLEKEEGSVRVHTIQGLCALSVCAFFMGKDRRGWIYQGQLGYAVKEYDEAHPPAACADDEAKVFEKAMNQTLWGLYNATTASAMSYQKVPLLRKPTRPLPAMDHSDTTDKWYWYPSLANGVDAHTQCILHYNCQLTQINGDMCWLLFDKANKPTHTEIGRAAIDIHARLLEWHNTLPDCLAVTKDKPLPQMLTLHMYYHTIVITLFSFLKKSEDSKEGSSVSKDSANEAFSSARAIAQLMETQRLTWGIQILPSSSIQWITVSLFTLLDDMDEPESIKAFVSLCVAAKAASRRWPLGKGMLRAVQLQARQAGVSLPMETQTLFVDFESASWSSKDLENLSSLYPNFAMSVKSGKNDDIELDKFLKRWDGLNLRMGN